MTLLSRETSLILGALLLVPSLVNAQSGYNAQSDSLSADSLNGVTDIFVDIPDDSDILLEMPVFNPDSNAAFLMYEPNENIVYNMPVFGLKDSLKVKSQNFSLNRNLTEPK